MHHGGPNFAPTLLGHGTPRLPRGGKIRTSINVQTRRAAEVHREQAIYDQGLKQSHSFAQIQGALAETCPDLKSLLAPRNLRWFAR